MEEADVLSDEIAGLIGGVIKFQGSTLEIKNKYGGGYMISLITKDNKLNYVKDQI